ncbi:MAG: hypothetical protein HY911_15910 [Desulfobacterales bacterium]|nr:hypothetical protein [Desulfobacterales bacterium]
MKANRILIYLSVTIFLGDRVIIHALRLKNAMIGLLKHSAPLRFEGGSTKTREAGEKVVFRVTEMTASKVGKP